MPRIFRILPEEGMLHILTRGNNRQAVFHDDADYQCYLHFLKSYKEEHKFFLYHYCLMPNHVHLIMEATKQTALAKLMKQINLAYLYHYKKRYSYFGHLWQGRYKSLIIDRDEYLITCGRYIELNHVRAKLVKDPKDYKWSSYKVYAYGGVDGITDINPLYDSLGKTQKERWENYRLPIQEEAVNLNLRFFGSKRFINKMEEKFGVDNLKIKRGRPKKIEK